MSPSWKHRWLFDFFENVPFRKCVVHDDHDDVIDDLHPDRVPIEHGNTDVHDNDIDNEGQDSEKVEFNELNDKRFEGGIV